jgi:hypothetical protein
MVFRWTFHYPHFPFSFKTTIYMFFLHFIIPTKPDHKLYPWLINFISTSCNTCIWFTEFFIIKFSCFFLLVNFLQPPIHSSLTHDIQKLLLILHLVLVETWAKGTKGSLPLFIYLITSFNHCSHYGNISQDSH